MSFFDDLPAPPPPPEPTPVEPRAWMGPPPGWIGGWVPWHVELGRSDATYSVLTEVSAFPTGVEFTIFVLSRSGPPGPPPGAGWRRMGHPLAPGSGTPRLGIGYADGRKAATGVMPPMSLEEPGHPILRPQGGGGGGFEWRQRFWLWPLPPVGPLLVVASEGGPGSTERTITLDATELVDASGRAEKLWDVDPDDLRFGGGRWSQTRLTSSVRSTARPDGQEGEGERGGDG